MLSSMQGILLLLRPTNLNKHILSVIIVKFKKHHMHYVNFFPLFLDLLSRIDLDELMKKDEPPLEFPDTLEGFEYIFNESKSYMLCKGYA